MENGWFIYRRRGVDRSHVNEEDAYGQGGGRAFLALREVEEPGDEIVLCNCTSTYVTREEDMNLPAFPASQIRIRSPSPDAHQ
jgi:hypothetical protein